MSLDWEDVGVPAEQTLEKVNTATWLMFLL